jgi:hypothetical protein
MWRNFRISLIILVLAGVPLNYTQARRNTRPNPTGSFVEMNHIGPQGPEPGGGGHGFANLPS